VYSIVSKFVFLCVLCAMMAFPRLLFSCVNICYFPTGEYSGCVQLAVCPVIAFMDGGSWSNGQSTTSATVIVPSCTGTFKLY